MAKQLEKTSKFLSYVLRHHPDAIGLTLDAEGWADVSTLIHCAATQGTVMDLDTIRAVVANNDKQRFSLDEVAGRIRANQGHSVKVDLGLQSVEPPDVLYHGTATRFLTAIKAEGLKPGSRQHVHMSALQDTATDVGGRHGKPVILIVQASTMHAAGHAFYCAENGVWLTDHVPVEYLMFPDMN